MSKELPYFRFNVSEWLNDDISLEDYRVKGVFADVIAYYWFKDCSITLAMLEKRFKDARAELDLLFELGVIKLSSDENNAEVKFLNEQYDVLSEKRKKRQEAGRIGGLRKSSNAKAKLKQNSSYKDKDKDKDKDKTDVYPFDDFWNDYDHKQDRRRCEKKWNSLSDNDKLLIKANVPRYVKSTPDIKYRKHPYTYLNNEAWLNELSEQKDMVDLFSKYKK